uniref:Phosphoserine phosphatase n=1 Tax=Xenopsylla cheopis TaxID=163159 RepID=A0A6M2DXJ3_XENCH
MDRLTVFGISVMSCEAASALSAADAVCFDVDSTVIREEGIDELSRYLGKGGEVAKLTKEAMKGSMSFQEALTKRLDIIRPSQQNIADFISFHPSTLTPGIKNLVAYLHRKRIPVYLVSGGFRSLIEPVAKELGIPFENIFANRIIFFYDGNYAGFDASQPTSRSGGKGQVLKLLREQKGYKHIAMIGDGATDLEAQADTFIGFGGNVVREEVKSKAQFYITDFQELQL